MTAYDVYKKALEFLDEIDENGDPNEDTGYEGKAPGIIDSIQRDVAFLADVKVLTVVSSLDDTLYVNDDHALRVMPYGVAAEFALQDKMADEYQKNYSEYKVRLRSVRPDKPTKRDPYSLMAGMQ